MSLLPPRSDFVMISRRGPKTPSSMARHAAMSGLTGAVRRLRAGKRNLATNRWRAVETWGIKRRAG